jgi:hypothetical protein
MASDPLAPHTRVVSILDPALDPEKFTLEKMKAYLESYDKQHVDGCARENEELTWFCITQLKQTTLADEIDPIEADSRKLKLAFLHCCHRVERGASVFEVEESELTRKSTPKLAGSAWWDRIGDEFGAGILYSIGSAILQRARLPKAKRAPLH